ncbi:fungal specific transcription factor domain protein [Rhizoctonia solani AG-3 Rhs1AP]|uniref:Fungal specific transcription factor domain protein n=2 Tax=Rhizoctonia solani AG-3 TaxID=1086053 RepID=A0A074S9W0_9AGAM|nr:fungal specific transcription factor domain protein [Rhizoctonia solani AG-3 Rhs1AP]KEP53688.1 fungal specific transcription factor domain protein [Rhizoctonia solani 123E]
MPKSATSSGPALRRNQACQQCRRRKLKCDAGRPHCGTCVRQWNALIAVPPPVGFSHPPAPTCSYDPVEGVPVTPESIEDPLERIKVIEAQIEDLQSKLHNARREAKQNGHDIGKSPSPPTQLSPEMGRSTRGTTSGSDKSKDRSPTISPQPYLLSSSPASSRPSTSPSVSVSERKHATPYARPRVATRANTATGGSLHVPVRRPPTSSRSLPADYSPQAQLDKDWDLNLPAPNIVAHLVELFFQNEPCSSRILHRSSFVASLSLPKTHPDFPPIILLHAICCASSRWASHDAPSRQEKFAEFHAAKTRAMLDTALRANATDLPTFQASIILQYWAYAEGRNLDIKFNARPFLEPTPSNTQMEEKRRAWWSLVMFDRYVSLGAWKPSVAETDLMAIELPICTVDFECESLVSPNPQKVHDPTFFLSHPIGYTDSYIILIKATLLFGKVTEYNLTVDSRPSRRSGDPRDTAVFRALDRLVAVDFLQSLPDDCKSCLGAGSNGSMVDADLYLAHVLPYAATISLHNAHIDYSNPGCPSAVRCIQAARSIIRNYFLLNGTLFDTKRLHPFVTVCWYLAAVVLVQLCKRHITTGDRGGEATVWGEIETLKLAMLEFGNISPIGLRQEKLLQETIDDVIQKPVLPANFGLDIPMYTYPLQDLTVSLSEHGSPEGSTSFSTTGYL